VSFTSTMTTAEAAMKIAHMAIPDQPANRPADGSPAPSLWPTCTVVAE
jgi:hypothetical protein